MLGRRRTPPRAAPPSVAQERLAAIDASFVDQAPLADRRGRRERQNAPAELSDPEPASARARPGRHVAPSAGPGRAGSLWASSRLPLRSLALTAQQVTLLALAVAAVVIVAAWWVMRAAPHGEPVQLTREIAPLTASGAGETAAPTASGTPAPSPSSPAPSAVTTPVVVDVAGKVRKPGIVELPAGSRVVDAL